MTLTRAVWKLLRTQWWVFLNGLRRAKGRTRFGYAISVVVLLGLAVGAFWLSRIALSFLQTSEAAELLGPTALEGIPTLILSTVFLATFLISFQVLLQALYLAGDMDFLLSSPIPARAVFVAKLLQAVLPNLLYLGLFTLPILWGLGAANGYNVLYYPLGLPLLVLQVLTAASLSALLVMAVVRIFPARRVFEVISFLGAIAGLLCSQWHNLSQTLSRGNGEVAPTLAQAAGSLSRFGSPWVPLAWPGLGLMALAQERWFAALGYLALSAGVSVGVFVLTLHVAEQLYYSGWAKVRVSPARKPKRAVSRASTKARRIPLLPSVVGSIVQKDLRMLRRDLRNLSQLISPIIFAIVYAIMMLGGRNKDVNNPPPEFVTQYTFYLTILIVLFACWMLVNRLALMSFSQEGKQYWILRTAPVSAGQLALAKWLVAFLPSVIIGGVLMVGIGIAQRAAVGDMMFGLLVVVFVSAGNSGLTLAFGITSAKLDWTDPRRMIASGAGCLASLSSMVFHGASLALFLSPAPLLQFLGGPNILGQLIGLALGGTLSLLVAFLPPRLVLKRIPLIGGEAG